MKKFYSFLAGIVLALTASAVPQVGKLIPSDFTMQVKPEMQQVIRQQRDDMVKNLMTEEKQNSGMQKIQGDKDQSDWKFRLFQYTYTWAEMLVFTNPNTGEQIEYSFDELPGYCVQLVLYKTDREGKVYDLVWYDFVWPTVASYTCMNSDGSVDWDKATKMYGTKEAAQAPMPIEQLIQTFEGDSMIAYPSKVFPVAGIMSPNVKNDWCYWHGTPKMGFTCSTLTSQGALDYSKASFITFQDYDANTNYIEFDIYTALGPWDENLGNVREVRGRVEDTYSGEDGSIRAFGVQEMEISEMHIFKVGELTPSSDAWLDFDTEPTNCYEYYIAACSPGYTFDTAYTASSLPTQVHYLTEYIPFNMNYFCGPIYGDLDGESPYGIYEVPTYTTSDYGNLEQSPGPGIMLSTIYYTEKQEIICTKYGVQLTMNAYMCSFRDGKTKFGIGDKEKGFNAQWVDTGGGCTTLANYTGDIIYHNDPTDYTKTITIPAIGTVDANVQTVNSAVETIVSDSPVVGVEYYNFQGMRMQNAPESGLYIKREIKADGSFKSTKIAR